RLAQATATPLPLTVAQRAAGDISAIAEALPITSAELSLAATGVVSEVLVGVGDLVCTNQVLLRLDGAQEMARLKQAQAMLGRARATHASALASLATAQ